METLEYLDQTTVQFNKKHTAYSYPTKSILCQTNNYTHRKNLFKNSPYLL